MKAITVLGPGDIRMIETEKPRVGRSDVLVRVMYSGICGTDLSIMSGDTTLVRDGLIEYPVRIGHEWSGIVEEVGQDVTKFNPGDRVVSDSGVSCGECKYCIEGHYELCENGKSIGTINCWDGSFAEYILIPERHLYKLPEEISLDEAALIEPATIALDAIKHSNVTSGSNVLIIGTGSIGLSAIPFVKTMGAAKVMVSGRKPYKLNVAKVMGADITINIIEDNLVDIVMEETDGKGVDIIIEASGDIDTINQSLELIKHGGRIVLIGFYETNLNDFNLGKFVIKGVQMKGIHGEFGLPQEVIDIMKENNISLKPLITHRFRFHEAIEAMKTADEKNDTKIKMLIEMS